MLVIGPIFLLLYWMGGIPIAVPFSNSVCGLKLSGEFVKFKGLTIVLKVNMTNNFNKAKSFYQKTEKSAIEVQDPLSVVKTMVNELKKSMNMVVSCTGVDNQRTIRTKHFSRSLVIIYTLQTTLDFEKGQNLATKLFQIYEYCRQQMIKCFKEQAIDGANKAINALNDIFSGQNELKNA